MRNVKKMKRDKLESYLGKYVKITLFDNTVYKGILHKTGEKAFVDDPNLSIPLNFYFCTDKNNEVVNNSVFRVSHIMEISNNKKYGRWESNGNFLGCIEYRCSNCSNYIFFDSKDNELYPYCPYCGIKMDNKKKKKKNIFLILGKIVDKVISICYTIINLMKGAAIK